MIGGGVGCCCLSGVCARLHLKALSAYVSMVVNPKFIRCDSVLFAKKITPGFIYSCKTCVVSKVNIDIWAMWAYIYVQYMSLPSW